MVVLQQCHLHLTMQHGTFMRININMTAEMYIFAQGKEHFTRAFWETDLWPRPAVSKAGPQQSDQVDAIERAQQCQHHVVVFYGGKQLGRARYVHEVRRHKEGTPKECEMVTQTLCEFWSAFIAHLGQRENNHCPVYKYRRYYKQGTQPKFIWSVWPVIGVNSPGSHWCSTPPGPRPRTCTWS